MSYFSLTIEKSVAALRFEDTINPAPEGDPSTIPAAATSFMVEVDKLNDVLKQLFSNTDSDGFQVYFKQLVGIARMGVYGQVPPLALAQMALSGWKENLVNVEGPRMQNRRLLRLGIECAQSSAVFLTSGLVLEVLRLFVDAGEGAHDGLGGVEWVRICWFAFLLAATSAGVWVSAATKQAPATIETLAQDPDSTLGPRNRITIALLLSFGLGLALVLNVVSVNVGSINSGSMGKNVLVALLLGLVFGFNERRLSTSFIDSVGKLLPGAPPPPPPVGGGGQNQGGGQKQVEVQKQADVQKHGDVQNKGDGHNSGNSQRPVGDIQPHAADGQPRAAGQAPVGGAEPQNDSRGD